ncbi:Integrase catalytic domain-containing protein, partial [Durusdinium trenchii]
MQNMNLVKRDFIKRLREAKVLLRFAVKVIEEVINYGGVYLLEQPLTSKAWMETVLQQIMNREDCILAQCDQCQYGLQDYHGGKMKKSTGWITNSPQIANRLDKKCDGTHEHTHVLGSSGGQNRSTQAQIYPRPLIQAILDGYREEIQRQGHPKVSEQMQWMTMVDCHHLEDRIRQYENLWKWFIEEEKEKIHLVQALEEKQEEEDENEDEEGKKWLPRERPFSLEQLVRRAHEGLGHPGNDRLARILQGGGASKKAIEYAKKLTCSVCQQHQLVRPPRAAAPPKELPPNHTVGIDTIWLPTPGKKRRMALNIVCWATRFQMVIPLRSHTAPDARRAYLEWVRFMGVPQRLFTDLGKEFCSAFQDGAELDETLVEPSALEMPTQRAITERAGKTFKEILEKAMDNYATQSESEWRDLVDIVNMTVNRLTNKSGYSPCQRLLGYTPKMPGGLQFLTEEEKKERQWANRGDLQMQRAQTMRLAAAKAFHEIECQQAMKNAIHHGRRSIKDFEGLSHLRQIIEEEPKAGYIDLTKEYKEEDFEDEEEDIPLESRDSRKEKPKYKIEGKTERKDVVMREEEDEWLWNEAKQTLTRFHLQYRQHLFKPTDVSDCPVDYNKLGPQRRTTMYFEDGSSKEIVDDWHEEAQPVHKRWKGRTEFQMMIEKFAWEKGEPEAEETTRMTSPTVSLSGTTTEEAKIGLKRGAGEDEENNEGLEKRARTETVEDQKKEEEPIRGLSRPFEIDGEDQEQIPKRQRIDWFEVMINTVMPVMKKPKGQNEIKLKQLLDE